MSTCDLATKYPTYEAALQRIQELEEELAVELCSVKRYRQKAEWESKKAGMREGELQEEADRMRDLYRRNR